MAKLETRMAASKVRANMSDVLNRVRYGNERIIVTKGRKDRAVLVPIDTLRFLEALEKIEPLQKLRKT